MRRTSEGRPILVTGSHRSGSTWVGQMIAASPRVGYIYEPFNIGHVRPGISAAPFQHWLEYIAPGTEGPHRRALEDTLSFRYRYGPALRAVRSPRDLMRAARDAAQFAYFRATRKRPLVKDPLAVFSAEWLQQSFDMDIVVVIRHPAAFVTSIRRLGWRFSFAEMLRQPALIRDLLQPYEGEIREAAAGAQGITEEAALLWKLIHHAIAVYQQRHPDWIYVRHEDLSMAPIERFSEVYARLALPFTDRERGAIARGTGEDNPAVRADADTHTTKLDSRANAYGWRTRMDAGEVLRIRALVEPYGSLFYRDDEW